MCKPVAGQGVPISEVRYDLTNFLIKQILGVILKPLTYLINVTLLHGIVLSPDCLKLPQYSRKGIEQKVEIT